MSNSLMKYWLLKSEPETFSIDHLAKLPNQTSAWDGVRNYQARNFMRDSMQIGDLSFFYHSNCKTPGIVGTVKIVRLSYPDHTAFDPASKYYDPSSSVTDPRWFMVDVKLLNKFPTIVALQELRNNPKLKGMLLLRPGNRLSITPVSKEEWESILNMLS